MAIRLTKTSKILFAIGIVVLSVALGFLIWRVNQTQQLDPGDSDAADACPVGCFSPADGRGGCASECWWECTDGTKTKDPTGGCSKIGYKTGLFCSDCKVTELPPGDFFVNHSDCQKIADQRNSIIGMIGSDSCDKYPENSKWVCKEVFTPDGFKLTYSECTSTTPPPTVDCSYDLEPTTYAFNKANTDGSKIGPFTEDGKLVFFFKNLLDNNAAYRPKITFKVVSTDSSRNNQTYVYKPTAGEERKETTFAVKKGEYLLLTDSNDDYDQGSPECAPTTNNPKYKSFGWIAPSGGSCGSGLQGPPTNGTRTAYEKVSISSFRSNALTQGYKQLPKGEQCWADWREWVGDYDFNDYFLMVSYVTDAPTQTANMSVSKVAVESCTGEDTENPIANLTYSVTVTNSGGAAGTVSKVEDVLDSKVKAGSVSAISDSGQYSDGKITWNFVPAESIGAGGKKVLTYKVAVDKANFGSYQNSVSVVTSQGTVTAEATIVADCVITETPDTPETPVTPTEGTVPQTGIFDSTASRIVAGFVLLTFGAVIYNLPNSTFTVYKKGKSYKYRDRFEKRVANR